MQQPFDIILGDVNYAVFPEGNDTYAIYKDGKEYALIQKDTDTQWIKLDAETGTPDFEADEEINQIGREIVAYVPPAEDDELDEDED
ncbi:hypothetical protein [Pedobacter deserti]|uniref:hypothetical protein n=1 Tax=Pedobacter deserti TaxID=2817382 RepID=UPI0021096B5A|nr:hypothetical protein [Pedobacter sp. SYSU D00382]